MCPNACKADRLCPDCRAEYEEDMRFTEWFNALCRNDPYLDPTHKPATDEEWRAWRLATTVPAVVAQSAA